MPTENMDRQDRAKRTPGQRLLRKFQMRDKEAGATQVSANEKRWSTKEERSGQDKFLRVTLVRVSNGNARVAIDVQVRNFRDIGKQWPQLIKADARRWLREYARHAAALHPSRDELQAARCYPRRPRAANRLLST